MRLQEFVNPFCEEAEKAFSQPNPSIEEIAENLRLKHKTKVSLQTALLGVRSAKGVESAFRIREREARFFQELGFVIPG